MCNFRCRVSRSVKAAAFAVLCALFTPSVSRADFDCIAGARGGTLTWDVSWQSDQLDDAVPYRVASVSDHRDRSTRTVTLELVALGSAKRSVRYFSISDRNVARTVCMRIVNVDRAPQHTPETISTRDNRMTRPQPPAATIRAANEPRDPTTTDTPDFPFIRYSPKGWVRSDPPPYEAVTLCEIAGKRFRCLQQDKSAHGRELAAVEDELAIVP